MPTIEQKTELLNKLKKFNHSELIELIELMECSDKLSEEINDFTSNPYQYSESAKTLLRKLKY